jgi:hypothetical protein
MYPRYLQAENSAIAGSFIYSHRYMQGKRLMEFRSHLSGYQMTARWKAVDARPEEGKERLHIWHVESNEKDKNKVTRFLESMYNMNQRKLVPLGYKLQFLFDVREYIRIHGRDKTLKLFDREADFIKIHRYVRVPGVKGAYYEDKRADFIMLLNLKGIFKQLFHSHRDRHMLQHQLHTYV